MDKIIEIIEAYKLAKEQTKRTRFIIDLVEPGNEEFIADIQDKHEQLMAFCEKVEPMMKAIEKAATPYIELMEFKSSNLHS